MPVLASNISIFTFYVAAYSPGMQATSTRYAPTWFDQGLGERVRVLESGRLVGDKLPGFIYDDYRFRHPNQVNGFPLSPTVWNRRVAASKYISGIGDNQDLEPLQIVEETDGSTHLQVQHGYYYVGPDSYYLHSDSHVWFNIPAASGGLELPARNREQIPTFVGTYRLGTDGMYRKDKVYHYVGTTASAASAVEPEFYLPDRNTIVLSESVPDSINFLGLTSGSAVDYFYSPIFPVAQIESIAVGQFSYATSYSIDAEGLITLSPPSGSQAGTPIYANIRPGIAIEYETDEDDVRTADVDLNQASAGISSGYVFLLNRPRRPLQIVLTADKQPIAVPSASANFPDYVAYGPIAYQGDYALLSALVTGRNEDDPLPGIRLRVQVEPGWRGRLNYKDPSVETVELVTGSDGIATAVYTPNTPKGWYIALPAVSAGNTITLPETLELSQVRNDIDGWLVSTFYVLNNDPLAGMVGASADRGQVPFAEYGVSGTASYHTNGLRTLWVGVSAQIIRPASALDENGVNYLTGGFTGFVKKLVYADPLPSANVGAYFVSFLERVILRLLIPNSNVRSNTVILQMEVPSILTEQSNIIRLDTVPHDPFTGNPDPIKGRINAGRLIVP